MKLLFLGGGGCQLNSILKAKALGHEVILCDYLPNCVARPFVDVFAQVSTFDHDAITEVARENDVDGFVCVGTDQPVLTAAVVAERLGKHFYVDVLKAKLFTNKLQMKELFDANRIPTIAHAFIEKDFEDDEIDHLQFSVVVKPVDSQGQRGVLRLNSIAEVRAHFDEVLSYSQEKQILVEEFYLNDEITFNGWMVDGEMFTLSIVDRVTFQIGAHLGICLAHNFPSFHLDDYLDEFKAIAQKIVNVSGIQNGPIYFQFLVGGDGVKVNEIAARIGGAYEDVTIPMISGVDLLDLLFKEIAGETIDVDALRNYAVKESGVHLSTQLFFVRPSVITKLPDVKQLEGHDFIEKVAFHKTIGTVIETTKDATNRAGYMIVRGDSREDMLANLEKAFDLLVIEDERGENMVIKYGNYEGKYRML